MLASSRRLFFWPKCRFKPPRDHYALYQVEHLQKPRSFSASTILGAVKKKWLQSAPKPAKASTTQSSPLAKVANTLKKPVYQTYAAKLAEKGQPTLIYIAPSHTAFLISSYSAAGFCFAYSGYNFWHSSLYAPPDLASWVPIAFGVVCIGMSAMGTWLMLSPSHLIRSITAVPKSVTKVAAGGKPIPRTGQPDLELQIELRRMIPLPFLKPRKLYIKPEDIVIRSSLVRPPARKLTPEETYKLMLHEKEEKKKALEYEQTHIMSAPFRHMSKFLFNLFKAIARAWTREGFAKLRANGQTYKLDVTGGWALDGGKALDRLVTLKPEI